MLKVQQALVFIFLATATIPLAPHVAYSDEPKALSCRSVLATFIAGDSESETYKSIQDKIQLAADIRRGDAVLFSPEAALTPLFKRGIVHRLIAEDLAEHGHRSVKEIQSFLVLFSTVYTEEEQLKLVLDVVDRIVKNFDIDTTPLRNKDGVKDFQKNADKFDLDLPSYAKLVTAVKKQAPSEYMILKLAVLEELVDANPEFAADIAYYNKFWDKAVAVFSRKKKTLGGVEAPAVPQGQAVNLSDMQKMSVHEQVEELIILSKHLSDVQSAERFNRLFVPTIENIGENYCSGMNGEQFLSFGKSIYSLSRKLSGSKRFLESIKALIKASQHVYLSADQRDFFTSSLATIRLGAAGSDMELWNGLHDLDQKWGKTD